MDESTDSTPERGASIESAPRVIASIVDPSVRDDGRGEPHLVMRNERARPAIRDVGSATLSSGSGHPVRDRLLAKARAASGAAAVAPPLVIADEVVLDESDLEHDDEPSDGFLGFESLPQLADDLDLIGAPERRRNPQPGFAGAPLTAPAASLLGTLFGVTSLAVLFAVLIQIAPHEPVGVRSQAAVSAPLDQSRAALEPSPRIKRPPRQRVEGPWRIAKASDPALKRLEGSVGSNSFLGAMQAAGISLREAYRVLTAFDGVKDLNRCRPKDAFSALLDAASGRLTAFEYGVSDEEVYQARAGKDGLLIARKLDLRIRRDRVQGVIVMQGEFEAASQEAGFEPGLSEPLNKALAGYSSVADLKQGDVLALVAQEVTVLGEFSRYAGVEALEYRPVGAEAVRIYYHETEKSRGYVDSKGRVFGKSRWTRPVPGAAVTSRYNPKRLHPILKRIKPHNGTDFGAPIGTPVVAAGFGKVTFVGEAGPNGNMITLEHSGGYQTGYSHLSRFAKGIKVGVRVEQKQLIGYVGSTGRSTGPHLHFSAKKNGRFIDGESLNLDAFSRLAVSDRELLTELRQRYDQLLNALHIPEPRAPSPEIMAQAYASPGAAIAATAALNDPVAHSAPAPAGEPNPVSFPVNAAVPAAAPIISSAVAAPRSSVPPLSIYISDQELMARQPATHDGEVDP